MFKSVKDQVISLLAEVEPILGIHGGSIEFVDLDENNVVSLRFKGACVGCAAADITLEYGLKEMIMLKIEEVTDVISVNTEAVSHQAPTTPLAFPHA